MNERAARAVERLVREQVRGLSAYHVPSAKGLIKLDAMENPYAWPPELVDEWLAELRGIPVNRYPDPDAGSLRARLREVLGIPAGAEILLGNGSDELIQLLALTLGDARACVLAPEPSFVMYRATALAARLGYVGVALDAADFELDLPAMLEALEREAPAVVFLAYPNNPTGNLFQREAMHALIEAAPGLVVVDEAYAPFAGDSFLPELARYPNLLVMRTLSKVGLAGLRLGLLAGSPLWLEQLNKLRLPYNINVLTQATADFALRHYAVLEAQTASLREQRGELHRALARMSALEVWPSRANFLLFRVPDGRAGAVAAGLRERGVLIKNLHGAHPLLEHCLRVTVGKPEENGAFVNALTEVLG